MVKKILQTDTIYRSRAPLRVSFGGGGSDLPNYIEKYGGLILNATINRYVYASITKHKNQVVFQASDCNLEETLPLAPEYAIDKDCKLPLHRAIYNRIIRDYNDGHPLPLTLHTSCDAPVGSGLGTSSALTVTIIRCFASVLNVELTEAELANLAHDIERKELGLAGGLQDQYAAAYGGFNYMEFKPDGTVIVNQLRISPRILAELEYSTILYFSGISRISSNIIEKQKHNIENDDEVVKTIGQIKQLAIEMKNHLLTNNLTSFAQAIHDSWMLKRQTDKSITNKKIDELYELARKNGVIGGKISGAGGGGFLLLLVDPVKRHQVLASLPQTDVQAAFCSFVKEGATSWVTKR